MISTTIFTTFKGIAIPRTLSLEIREGSGNIFLDTTKTIFYPEWQCQLQTVFKFVKSFFEVNFRNDFFVSVDAQALKGWSTSLPLFLLFASALTGEFLPKNIFSTGCMFSPNGWISQGKFEAVQSKIQTSNAFAEYSSIENPVFLIPSSFYQYESEKVELCAVTSVFSALARALPHTYQHHRNRIEALSRAESQSDLRNALPLIPATGEAFITVSADVRHLESTYSQKRMGKALFISENLSDGEVYLYFIRERTVIFKHSYPGLEEARAAIPFYREVLP